MRCSLKSSRHFVSYPWCYLYYMITNALLPKELLPFRFLSLVLNYIHASR